MTKSKLMTLLGLMCLTLFLSISGCGGGGGGTPATVSGPSIEVQPASFDFGTETVANQVAALEVKILNNGLGDLVVSDIALKDTVNFGLDVRGGSDPCLSTMPTVLGGGSCTVVVDFLPTSEASFGTTLVVTSNDSTTPSAQVELKGERQTVSQLNVTINQVEACPRPQVTAYVSVTDQAGFPVTTLIKDDFEIFETTSSKGSPVESNFVENTATLSVALVLDYSGSIIGFPDSVDDMETAAADFVGQMRANDEAEVIKFSDTPIVVQGFTSNQAVLTNAIRSENNRPEGTHTALYDAIVLAADDIGTLGSKVRKAVVLITDGQDDDGTSVPPNPPNPQSDSTLATAITYATDRGIPVFTIGLGQVDDTILRQIADETGGTFSDSTTSDNLLTIYQQLADLLFTDQYILTYATSLLDTETATLKIIATDPADPMIEPGEDTANIAACAP